MGARLGPAGFTEEDLREPGKLMMRYRAEMKKSPRISNLPLSFLYYGLDPCHPFDLPIPETYYAELWL